MQCLSVIDVHTGLGKWRQNSLFYEPQPVDADELPPEIAADVSPEFAQSTVGGYAVHGGQVDLYRQLFPDARLSVVTQECGTYAGVRILKGAAGREQSLPMTDEPERGFVSNDR